MKLPETPWSFLGTPLKLHEAPSNTPEALKPSGIHIKISQTHIKTVCNFCEVPETTCTSLEILWKLTSHRNTLKLPWSSLIPFVIPLELLWTPLKSLNPTAALWYSLGTRLKPDKEPWNTRKSWILISLRTSWKLLKLFWNPFETLKCCWSLWNIFNPLEYLLCPL